MKDAIVVTLSQQTIKDRRGGLRTILKEWRDSDGENRVWLYRLGNAPKHDIQEVYWVIAGRIRWKSKFAGIDQRVTIKFGERTLRGKAWLILFDFEPIPRKQQIALKGFQGFRYFNPEQL